MKTLKELFEEKARFYNIFKNENNLANADLACLIDECLENRAMQENTNKTSNKIQEQVAVNMIKDADQIIENMKYLLEQWQNLKVTSDPQETMLSRWFALMAVSAYITKITEWYQYETESEHRINNKYSKLFLARDLFFDTALSTKVLPGECHCIFETIEGSLGYNGPIKLKPANETPGYIFALAKFLQESKNFIFN